LYLALRFCAEPVLVPSELGLRRATRALPNIGLLVRFCSPVNAGSVREPEPGSNRSGCALAANGRTARADADPDFVALIRWRFGLVA
jgi:hypothetical protein